MKCPQCNSDKTNKNGRDRNGTQKYHCTNCGKHFSGASTGKVPKPKTKNMGISVDEFRNKHDLVHILKKTFEKFEDETFYERADIMRMSGLPLSSPGVTTTLESEYFQPFTGKARGKLYFAKPQLINQMKEEGILQ